MAMAKSMVLTYGNKNICFDLDRGNLLGELRPRRDYNGVGKAEIDCAIKNPVGLKENIYQIARKKIKSPGDYVCIVVSDQTRSTGVEQYLEMLIDSLNREGIADEKIVLQFANGMHRPPTREEQKEKLGRRIYARFQGRIFVHDASDETSMVDVGTTTRDNRVRINRIVADARVKILTGSVMYHYFAGFGGGRKSILAGVSSADTIARNHSLTIDPNENRIRDSVEIGRLKGNPVAEDMEEAAALTGIDYIINTVMAEDNTIAAIAAGKVVLVGEYYLPGNTVVIDHGNGVVSMSMHLSEVLVSQGDRVKRGQVFGRSGATGRVTGAHLHLSVSVQGTAVDPAPLFEMGAPAENAALSFQ